MGKTLKITESQFKRILNNTIQEIAIKDIDKSGSDNNDLCDELTVSSIEELKSKMRGMEIPREDKVKINSLIKQMKKEMKNLDVDLDISNTYARKIQNILCTYSKEDKNNID